MNNDENKTPDAEQPSEPGAATPAAATPAAAADVPHVADAETQRLPEQPPVAASGTPEEAAAAPASSGNRRRNILLGVAAAVLLLGVGGAAYAIGANVGDNDDDDRSTSQQGTDGQHAPGTGGHGDRDDDRDDRDDSSDSSDDSQTGTTGSIPADAASLREAADAAIAAADAEGVVSIEVENGGYDVEVRLADGTEPDVFVGADGTTRVSTDAETDDTPDPLIDLAQLSDLIAAALDAASAETGTDGTIHSVSTSDDSTHLYEVDVRMPSGSDVDLELDADLAVVTLDSDS